MYLTTCNYFYMDYLLDKSTKRLNYNLDTKLMRDQINGGLTVTPTSSTCNKESSDNDNIAPFISNMAAEKVKVGQCYWKNWEYFGHNIDKHKQNQLRNNLIYILYKSISSVTNNRLVLCEDRHFFVGYVYSQHISTTHVTWYVPLPLQ